MWFTGQFDDPTRDGVQLVDQAAGSTGPVVPPAIGAAAHDIRTIDQKTDAWQQQVRQRVTEPLVKIPVGQISHSDPVQQHTFGVLLDVGTHGCTCDHGVVAPIRVLQPPHPDHLDQPRIDRRFFLGLPQRGRHHGFMGVAGAAGDGPGAAFVSPLRTQLEQDVLVDHEEQPRGTVATPVPGPASAIDPSVPVEFHRSAQPRPARREHRLERRRCLR